VVSRGMLQGFNLIGSTLILLASLLIGITLFTDLSWFRLLERVGVFAMTFWSTARRWLRRIDWHALMGRLKNYFVTGDKPLMAKIEPEVMAEEGGCFGSHFISRTETGFCGAS